MKFKGLQPETVLKALFLFASFASFVISITIYFKAGDNVLQRLNGIYVGVWVPSILSLGALVLSGARRPHD